jgi:hypothetical protein
MSGNPCQSPAGCDKLLMKDVLKAREKEIGLLILSDYHANRHVDFGIRGWESVYSNAE